VANDQLVNRLVFPTLSPTVRQLAVSVVGQKIADWLPVEGAASDVGLPALGRSAVTFRR
jgi:hypothetical protein